MNTRILIQFCYKYIIVNGNVSLVVFIWFAVEFRKTLYLYIYKEQKMHHLEEILGQADPSTV